MSSEEAPIMTPGTPDQAADSPSPIASQTPQLRGRGFLLQFLACQVAAFVLFAPGLARITSASNRYLFFWSPTSAWLRLGVVVLAGIAIQLLVATASELMQRWRHWLAILAECGLAAMVGWRMLLLAGVLAADQFALYCLAWAVTIAMGIAASRRFNLSAARWSALAFSALLFATPVLPIYWFNMLRQPTYAKAPAAPLSEAAAVTPRENSPQDNVYIFVMDGWSYRLTMQDGKVRADLPRLAEAAREMFVFTDAHSAGCHTSATLPRMIFKTQDDYALSDGQVGFWRDEFRPVAEYDSIFAEAQEQGYRTYMLGWFHPYHILLNGQADFVKPTIYHCWLGEGSASQAAQFAYEGLEDLLGREFLKRTRVANISMRNHGMVRHANVISQYTDAVLSDERNGQFGVFHFPLPHFPFCYSPEGLRTLNEDYPYDSVELAAEQIIYTDSVWGAIFDRLRSLDKYDRSTIVITSDHSWRHDPELAPNAHAWSHVPLFVKLPGQQSQATLDTPVNNVFLTELLRALEANRGDLEALRDEMATGRYYAPIDDDEASMNRNRPLIK